MSFGNSNLVLCLDEKEGYELLAPMLLMKNVLEVRLVVENCFGKHADRGDLHPVFAGIFNGRIDQVKADIFPAVLFVHLGMFNDHLVGL